jgi:hypothetical protein
LTLFKVSLGHFECNDFLDGFEMPRHESAAGRDVHDGVDVTGDVENAVSQTVTHFLLEVIKVGNVLTLKNPKESA